MYFFFCNNLTTLTTLHDKMSLGTYVRVTDNLFKIMIFHFYLSNLNLNFFFVGFFCVIIGLFEAEFELRLTLESSPLLCGSFFVLLFTGVVGVFAVESVISSDGSQQSSIRILGTVMSSGYRQGFRKCVCDCFQLTYPNAAFLKSLIIRGPSV